MKASRREFVAGLAALGAVLVTPLSVQAAGGPDFTPVVPPQPVEDAGKIEVLEFFSYGCPHCFEFSPILAAWAAKLPGDVVLRKVPVSFGRAAWGNLGRLFYALEVTGDLNRLEGDVFKAVHLERQNLFDEKGAAEWVGKKGVDAKKFSDAFNSFGVMSKVKRGDQMAQAYKISGVPALAVDGKYLVGGKDFGEALAITEKLIAKARAEKSGKK